MSAAPYEPEPLPPAIAEMPMPREATRFIREDELIAPRKCSGCGYDLRGLGPGGVCPECGLPKEVAYLPSIADPLSVMPIEVIKRFRLACVIATVVMIVGIVGAAWTTFVTSPAGVHVLMLGLAIGWVGVVWLLTPNLDVAQGVSRGFSSQSRLKAATRWLQLGWIVAAGCTLLIVMMPAPAGGPPAIDWILLRGLAIAAGLAGVWCLAIMLGRLAEWARDDFAERIFEVSLWGIPIGTPPLLFVNLGWLLGLSYPVVMMRGPAAVGIIIVLVIWMIALLAFPIAMLSLTKSVALSVVHHREDQARRRRQAARALEFDQRITERMKHV